MTTHTTKINRRALRDEAAFLPLTMESVQELRRALQDAGHSHRVANGVCSWLMAKQNGESDETAPDTRSRYRRILTELAVAQGRVLPSSASSREAHNVRGGARYVMRRAAAMKGHRSRRLRLSAP